MYATDRRQTKASLNASALWVHRHNNVQRINNEYSMVFRSGNYTIPIKAGTLPVPFRRISYSCKIRNAVVPFRSGNYTIPVKAGTLPVPFRRLSYSCKIRNETQSFRSAVPFRSGNYNDPSDVVTLARGSRTCLRLHQLRMTVTTLQVVQTAARKTYGYLQWRDLLVTVN